MAKSKCCICGVEINVYPSYARKYCSSLCYGKSKKDRVERECLVCSLRYEVKKSVSERERGRFCSLNCYYEYRKTVPGNRAGCFTKHLTRPSKPCKTCGDLFQVKPSKFSGAKYCSPACQSQSFSERMKVSNPNYKDGLSFIRKGERQALMGRKEYKHWRTAVFERDNYTCVGCNTETGPFNADHIKPWVHYPESRYDINNGRTLCVPCHKQTPTYGSRVFRTNMSIKE